MKRKKPRKPKYPAATIAYYGPDNRRATKVVVAIIASEHAEPDPLERWMTGTDVRESEKIKAQIRDFLQKHKAKTVVSIDRIIGCPHEEGEDYPEGTKCPFCPFWSNRDRFTHEVEE
jgi:hypothetical protein